MPAQSIALPSDISTMAGIEMLASEITKSASQSSNIIVNNAGGGVGRGVRRVSGKRLRDKVMNTQTSRRRFSSPQGFGRAAACGRERGKSAKVIQNRFDRRNRRSPPHSDGRLFRCASKSGVGFTWTARMAGKKLIKEHINVTAISRRARSRRT